MDIYRWMKLQWDRTAAAVVAVLGLVALLLGWLGVSDATLPSEQIPYLASGGVLGLFALGVAATLWLSADLRDEWRKLDDIHRSMQEQSEVEASPLQVAPPEPAATRGRSRLRAPRTAE